MRVSYMIKGNCHFINKWYKTATTSNRMDRSCPNKSHCTIACCVCWIPNDWLLLYFKWQYRIRWCKLTHVYTNISTTHINLSYYFTNSHFPLSLSLSLLSLPLSLCLYTYLCQWCFKYFYFSAKQQHNIYTNIFPDCTDKVRLNVSNSKVALLSY